MRIPASLFFVTAFASMAAPADATETVVFTILNPVQAVTTSGGTLSFNGTLFAPATNTTFEYLNGDESDVKSPLNIDDYPYYANFPLYIIPGQSVTGILFTVTVPAGAAVDNYSGFFSLLGGSSAESYQPIGMQSFSVNVTSTPAVPEPATWAMMIVGLGATALAMRKQVATRVSYAA